MVSMDMVNGDLDMPLDSSEQTLVLKGQLNSGSNLDNRWDENFLLKVLSEYHHNEDQKNAISRVWVCGPPKMNEDLDKHLRKIAPFFNIDPIVDVDIM